MRHLKLYESFRPIISYDFDGVLHRSVRGIHPISFNNYREWEPFDEMHEQMFADAEDHDIVVVTARPPETSKSVEAFIAMHNLPVKKVFYTDNGPKVDTLVQIGAIKHYDDNPEMSDELADTGIEFELVNPSIYESIKVKKENEDRTELIAYDGKDRAGYMIIEHNVNAYWYFEDDFSEDEYIEMFPDDEFMKFEHIEVEDNYRGRGVAQELIKAAIERTKKMGIKRAYLNASPMGTSGLSVKPLVALYKKFGFEEILDQGDNVQMILKLDKPLNEMMQGYRENGIVLLIGPELEDGTHRLYGAHVKKVLSYDRNKRGGEPGQSAKMVLLYDDTYRITMKDGVFSAGKTMNGNQAAGISSRRIVLNDNKTPKHWLTTKYQHFPLLFRELSSVIGNLPAIRWYN